MHVIITAGGTAVPLDDVRFITNGSKGNFPWQIALAFAARGWHVTVVGSERLVERVNAKRLPKNITLRSFTTYDDLVRELDLALVEAHPDVLLMAAAVSDYGPDTTVSGKISSEQDKLVIRLRRLPKILAGLRQLLDRRSNRGTRDQRAKTCLVGFKLTSGSTPAETLAKARQQMTDCHCNLVVANDLSQITKGQHPVTVVTPEGGAIPITGKRDDVAKQLVNLIHKRTHTSWTTTFGNAQLHCPVDIFDEAVKDDPDYAAAKKLLRLAQDTGTFDGSSGNISVRTKVDMHGRWAAPNGFGNDGLWTTPRGWPNKAVMTDQYLIRVFDAIEEWELTYDTRLPSFKPSIDSAVHRRLYKALPQVGLLIHTHSPWVLTDQQTDFPYPCGVAEEATEVMTAILPGGNPPPDTPLPDRFAVTLIHHGALIGRPKDGLDLLISQWQTVRDEYLAHLDEVQKLPRLSELTLFPIWGRDVPIGIAARHHEGWYALHLSPQFRGMGWGKYLAQVLIQQQFTVGTIDRCQVAEFYRHHGFTQTAERPDGTIIFTPPPPENEVTV